MGISPERPKFRVEFSLGLIDRFFPITPTLPHMPDTEPRPLTRHEIELEREKLRLERIQTLLTVIAIVLPLLATLVTFTLTRKLEIDRFTSELKQKAEEREITSKIEFLKLVTEKPELKTEAIKNWRKMFE